MLERLVTTALEVYPAQTRHRERVTWLTESATKVMVATVVCEPSMVSSLNMKAAEAKACCAWLWTRPNFRPVTKRMSAFSMTAKPLINRTMGIKVRAYLFATVDIQDAETMLNSQN